jgi:hypothetical protein
VQVFSKHFSVAEFSPDLRESISFFLDAQFDIQAESFDLNW